MKKIIILLTLMIFAVMINAQEAKIVGSWLMTKAEIGDKVQEPYYITEYQADGKMIIMGMDAGTWKFNKENNSIITVSEMDKDFNGESKIIKNTDEELIMTKDEAKLYYIKIDQDKINEDNKKSNLEGLWRIQSSEGDLSTKLLKFEMSGDFLLVVKDQGSTSRERGTWIFNPEEKNIIFMGFSRTLRGKNNINNITSSELVLEGYEGVIKADKDNSDSNKIERLSFTEEDFPELTDEAPSLPWMDFYGMLSTLKDVKVLKYRRGSLIKELNVFTYITILSEIEVNTEKQSVRFTNLSIAYGDTMQFSENFKGGMSEMYNDFFPRESMGYYRIVGVETVEVPAGKFECTVVEGIDNNKVKYWMINDKPGIYAKIIEEGVRAFDEFEYIVQELEEIK